MAANSEPPTSPKVGASMPAPPRQSDADNLVVNRALTELVNNKVLSAGAEF
jgi:hypothetical protein